MSKERSIKVYAKQADEVTDMSPKPVAGETMHSDLAAGQYRRCFLPHRQKLVPCVILPQLITHMDNISVRPISKRDRNIYVIPIAWISSIIPASDVKGRNA